MYFRAITTRLLLCVSLLPAQIGIATGQTTLANEHEGPVYEFADSGYPSDPAGSKETLELSRPLQLEYEGWPMSGANPQRTSWVPEDLSSTVPFMDVEWTRPIEAFIPPSANLIATNGMIYVSTAAGLYALDSETGDLIWRYDTDLPLGNSPTVVGGVAYVGGYDRKLHALDANSGAHLWSFAGASAGYDTNPLVISDPNTGNQPVVFIGNRDGNFYAIGGHGHSRQGQLLWSYKTNGPIHFSAAYKDGTIYFASDDNHAYAISAQGSLIWKSNVLQGDGFHSYWPVVFGDFVVFSGASGYRFGSNPGTASVMQANGDFLGRQTEVDSMGIFEGDEPGLALPELPPQSWSNGMNVVDGSAITEYFEENPVEDAYKHKPWRRVTFVLNRSDGTEYTFDSDGDGYQEYAPIPFHGTRQGNNYPPIVLPDGLLYSAVMFSVRQETDSFVLGWKLGTEFFSKLGASSRSALVEPHALSGGGTMMYRNLCCDRIGAYFSFLPGFPAGTFWSYDLYSRAPSYDAMWPIGFGNGRGDRLNGWFNGQTGSPSGIYHNHGDQNPLVPYRGKIYTHRSNAIIAVGVSTSTRELPYIPINPGTSDASNHSATDLSGMLENEIEKILDAGHLRPGYYNHQIGNYWFTNDYFSNPGDTLYTLSIAYPHLPSDLRADLESYLQAEFSEYFETIAYATIGWINGASREWMPLPEDVQEKIENPDPDDVNDRALFPRLSDAARWNYPPQNYYALYAYANNIPQDSRVSNDVIMSVARSKIDAALSYSQGLSNDVFIQDSFVHNAWLTGYIGYLRLQDVTGDTYLRTQVEEELERLLNLRWQLFDKDTPWVDRGVYYKKMFDVARNFMYLTPELGQYYRDNILAEVEEAIQEYELIAPYWFVTRFEATVGEGVMQHLYNIPALFQAKAWILNAPTEELQKYLDVPAFKRGDLFYIQNLVAALGASEPLPNANPPTIDPPSGIYDHPVTISMSGPIEGEIFYTTDGTTPTANSLRYDGPFTIQKSTMVKARVYQEGYSPSEVTANPYDLETIFEDVPYDHWAYDYIEALTLAGYVVGCSLSPPLFCPGDILNRSESSVLVLRGEYGPIPEPPHPPPDTATFVDVMSTFWGFNWIESLWQDGFTAGCSVDPLMYCPDQQHTRAEASVFFLRVKNGSDFEPPQAQGLLNDVDPGAWYVDWVEAAYQQGLLLPCSSDPLNVCPEELVDRASSAFMMVEAMGGLAALGNSFEEETITTPDIPIIMTPTPLSSVTDTPTPEQTQTPIDSSSPTPTASGTQQPPQDTPLAPTSTP